jgi:hypothetical protein
MDQQPSLRKMKKRFVLVEQQLPLFGATGQ